MPRGNRGLGIVGTMSPNRTAAVSRGRAKGGRGVRSPADLPGRGPGKADAPGHRNRNSPGGERRAAWDAAACRISGDDLPMARCSTRTRRPPRSGRRGSAESCTRAQGTRLDPLQRGGLIECDRCSRLPPAAGGDRMKVSDHSALHRAGARFAGLLAGAAGRIHGP